MRQGADVLLFVVAALDFAPVWLQRLAVQQDFVWFASLILWGVAGLLWWRHPERAVRWGWMPAAVGIAALTVAVQFIIFDPTFDWFQDRLVPGTTSFYEPATIDPELFGDFLLNLGWMAAAAWWWWEGTKRTGRARWRMLGLLGAALAGAWHFQDPASACWLWSLFLMGSLSWWWRECTDYWSRLAWGGVLVMGLGSTVGPMAILLGGLQRTVAATSWGLLVAAGHVLVAGLILGTMGRAVMMLGSDSEDEAQQRMREWRVFLGAATLWTVVGIGYAYQVGIDNRDELQRNRLRSVAAEAMVFDPTILQPVVGKNLKLEREEAMPQEPEIWHWRAAILATDEAHRLRMELARIVIETPFLDAARILVLHDGMLLELASSRLPFDLERVEVVRDATTQDVADWARAKPYIERDIVGEIGDEYYCRAPIVSAEGEVLGYLDYVRREFFQSLERKWRVGPLAVIALGNIAGFLVLLQRRAERQQQRAWRSAAAAADANRLKSAFIAKVSHELRTPLQSLLGYSELLAAQSRGEKETRQFDRLREHGELLLRIVNDLIDLSAMEAGRMQLEPVPTELDRLIDSVTDTMRPQVEAKGLSLRVDVAPALRGLWFELDPARLRQILFNLLGNAVKFTHHGSIEVKCRQGTDEVIRIEVHDTGAGIHPDRQAELFMPFTRLPDVGDIEGSGLGLAMVAALAGVMDGEAGVVSDGASGSCFWVEWKPRPVPAPAFEREVTQVATEPTSLAGRRIMVAEDNVIVRELFLGVLKDQGAECEWAGDGETALHAMLARKFDAVVLDIDLPIVDGIQVARRLRTAGVGEKALKIVGVSAHAGSGDGQAARDAGMDEFLTKPVSLVALCAALGGKPVTSPQPASTAVEDRLQGIFRADAENQMSRLLEAQASGDARELYRSVHYIANSAAAVGDEALLHACRQAEHALENQDVDAEDVQVSLREVHEAMAAWLPARA